MNVYNKIIVKSVIETIFKNNFSKDLFDNYIDYLEFNNKNCLNFNFENEIISESVFGNRLYFSYHFGPFLYIQYFLLTKKNIDLIFIASKYSEDKVKSFINFAKKNNIKFDESCVIYADSFTGLKEVINAMKNNTALFTLIDIGAGQGTIQSSKNSTEINLINSKIYVRNSIFNISKKMNFPITQVLTYWEENKRVLKFKDFDSNNFSIKSSWHDFENLLNKFPNQWESYHTIYKFFKIELENADAIFENDDTYYFQNDNFILICENENNLLFSKVSFTFYKISTRFTDIINSCIADKIKFKLNEINDLIDNTNLIKELIKNKIINKC